MVVDIYVPSYDWDTAIERLNKGKCHYELIHQLPENVKFVRVFMFTLEETMVQLAGMEVKCITWNYGG